MDSSLTAAFFGDVTGPADGTWTLSGLGGWEEELLLGSCSPLLVEKDFGSLGQDETCLGSEGDASDGDHSDAPEQSVDADAADFQDKTLEPFEVSSWWDSKTGLLDMPELFDGIDSTSLMPSLMDLPGDALSELLADGTSLERLDIENDIEQFLEFADGDLVGHYQAIDSPMEEMVCDASQFNDDPATPESGNSQGFASEGEGTGSDDDDEEWSCSRKRKRGGKARRGGSSGEPRRKLMKIDHELRKKEQNKNAATRYREKKRAEEIDRQAMCERLESRNKELRKEIEDKEQEVSVLRQLLVDILRPASSSKLSRAKDISFDRDYTNYQ